MADYSSVGSEERTEPISQTELEARIKNDRRLLEAEHIHDGATVPLDNLQLEDHHHRQGIRLLVRPLRRLPNARSMSPIGSDNMQWLALRAEVASTDTPEHKVLAVTQTSRDIKFSVKIPRDTDDEDHNGISTHLSALWCELYYDPASDKVIFLNKSDVPITLGRISQSLPVSPGNNERLFIEPRLAKALRPGTWRITVDDTDVLDFRILEKRPVTLYMPEMRQIEDRPVTASGSFKRSLTPDDTDEEERSSKRRASSGGVGNTGEDGAIVFLGPARDPLVFPMPNGRQSKELSAAASHALLDAEPGQTVAVGGMCEVDQYQLTKKDPIASTALSAVYTATHSRVPNSIVTVKVLKTRTTNPGDKPHVHERNVIRQADMWLRECQSQEDLEHDSIVRYYGGDARFLSLYMEHVDAQDLTAGPRWKSPSSSEFTGTREDAVRILGDISKALGYLHKRGQVHNDIKPANILYSPERGAVLCDFGLSTPTANAPGGGGTPYYVPPEFIGQKLRGPPSDVWALGVTMLYLLRKIPLPDSRARRQHAKPLYWLIAGINNPSLAHRQYGNGQSAVSQMRTWLTEIVQCREELNVQDTLERLVKEMLTPNYSNRITMSRVVRELRTHMGA